MLARRRTDDACENNADARAHRIHEPKIHVDVGPSKKNEGGARSSRIENEARIRLTKNKSKQIKKQNNQKQPYTKPKQP